MEENPMREKDNIVDPRGLRAPKRVKVTGHRRGYPREKKTMAEYLQDLTQAQRGLRRLSRGSAAVAVRRFPR
jgi:hypothetical protein